MCPGSALRRHGHMQAPGSQNAVPSTKNTPAYTTRCVLGNIKCSHWHHRRVWMLPAVCAWDQKEMVPIRCRCRGRISQVHAHLAQVCMRFSVLKPLTQHPSRESCHVHFFSRHHARHVAPRERSAVANPRRRSSDRKVERIPPAVATSTEFVTHGDLSASRLTVLRFLAYPKKAYFGCLISSFFQGGSVRPLGAPSSEADRDSNVRGQPSSALELPVIVVSQSGGRLFRNIWILHEGHKRRLKNLPWLLSPQPLPPSL